MNSSQTPPRAIHRARVIDAREVAPAHYQLRFYAPLLASGARPGQFVHVLTQPNAADWTFDPLLRRAFSIMSVEPNARESFDILFRVTGRGTKKLSEARINDEIDLIGPLGQPFDLLPYDANSDGDSNSNKMFHVKQNRPSAIVVGGGVGVPPLVYLSQILREKEITVRAIIGARSRAEVVGWNELNAVCEKVSVTTDDGSQGQKGRVTDELPLAIEQLTENQGGLKVKPVIYACGPLPMLRAVANVCAQLEVRCQVSLEENMPCGIGVCNGCVVSARQPFANGKSVNEPAENELNSVIGDEWSPYKGYRRVCVEGPACWADEIDWEHMHD